MKYIYDYKMCGEKSRIDSFVLLSSSPRRKELLSFLKPEILTSDIDERQVQDKFMAIYRDDDFLTRTAKTCCEISMAKSAIELRDNTMYISADTMVVYGDRIYNKPKDKIEAREMFMSYFGKKHHVVTSVCLRMKDYLDVFYALAELSFVDYYKSLDSAIDKYLESSKPMDKAGAYGIQELDPRFVEHFSGDINTIIGLPVAELSKRIFK